MAATLINADPPAARAANVQTTTASRAPETTAWTEAVFRVIADGRAHTIDTIERALTTPTSRPPGEAIVAEIERLRAHGMPIELAADRVIATPVVPLDRAALTRALADGDASRWRTEVVFATGSTNSDLLAAARAHGFVAPVLRAAELQLAGRGRLGRRWSSAPGASLTVSFALPVRRPLSALDGVTLVCGLAVHQVVADCGVRAQLKWPNDVLVDGDKLAGLLVEAHAVARAARETTMLVIGIGINVGAAAADDEPAEPGALGRTSLAAAGAVVDRNLLVARLARSLESHLAAFEGDGFGPFAARWNAVDAFADRSVTLDATLETRRSGIARGVDAQGALLIDIDGRCQRIVAGDVSLRPANGVAG